jgi:hypothetical protein
MKVIPLKALANQSITIRLDNKRYDMTFKDTNGVMSCTIVRDNEVILSGARIVAGTPLIPYKYLESGNFIFLTNNEELPDYTKFETTQSLIYASMEELAAIDG